MYVPQYIKNEMQKIVLLEQKKNQAMRKVEGWLESHGVDTEKLRDGSGNGLEELDYGNNIVDELCERIEKEF